MKLSKLYTLLEDWDSPKRLTDKENNECFNHWNDAITSIDSILYVIEDSHPPTEEEEDE